MLVEFCPLTTHLAAALPLASIHSIASLMAMVQGQREARAYRPQVLVVDDDCGMVDTLTDVLVASGYSVQAALSGDQAVALAHSTPCDLVLMDIRMPGISGVEAMRRIHEQAPSVPVVLMTAYAEEAVMHEAQQGAAALLRKPLDLGMTLDLLRALIKVDRPAR